MEGCCVVVVVLFQAVGNRRGIACSGGIDELVAPEFSSMAAAVPADEKDGAVVSRRRESR